MDILWNVLLGIGTVLSGATLLLQGFGLPNLAPWIDVLLRISTAFFAQWFCFRAFHKNWLRILPLLLTSLVSVWGFFLFLTSPSWRNATFGHFLRDYASFLLACAAFLFLRWLLPRLLPRMKKELILLFTRRKRSKAAKKDMPKFR